MSDNIGVWVCCVSALCVFVCDVCASSVPSGPSWRRRWKRSKRSSAATVVRVKPFEMAAGWIQCSPAYLDADDHKRALSHTVFKSHIFKLQRRCCPGERSWTCWWTRLTTSCLRCGCTHTYVCVFSQVCVTLCVYGRSRVRGWTCGWTRLTTSSLRYALNRVCLVENVLIVSVSVPHSFSTCRQLVHAHTQHTHAHAHTRTHKNTHKHT